MVVVALVSFLIFPRDSPLLAPVLKVSDHPSGLGGTDFPWPFPGSDHVHLCVLSLFTSEGTTLALAGHWRKMACGQLWEDAVSLFLTRAVSQLSAQWRPVSPSAAGLSAACSAPPFLVLFSQSSHSRPRPCLVKKQRGLHCVSRIPFCSLFARGW